jgi:hypothetical protein
VLLPRDHQVQSVKDAVARVRADEHAPNALRETILV